MPARERHIASKSNKPPDASQAYFWTERWQEGERKADEDRKAGRVKQFKSAAEVVKHLEGKG